MLKSEKTATDVVATVYKILTTADAESDAPAKNIIKLGQCLVGIGKAIGGFTTDEARRIIASAAALHGIDVK